MQKHWQGRSSALIGYGTINFSHYWKTEIIIIKKTCGIFHMFFIKPSYSALITGQLDCSQNCILSNRGPPEIGPLDYADPISQFFFVVVVVVVVVLVVVVVVVVEVVLLVVVVELVLVVVEIVSVSSNLN